MKRRLIIAGLVATLIAGGVFFWLSRDSGSMTHEELRKKFRCDRITAEVLATDIYCKNPGRYYEDVKNGSVIEGASSNQPRR